MAKWKSNTNLNTTNEAFLLLKNKSKLTFETDLEYLIRKNITLNDVEFGVYKDYFCSIKINKSNRIYIIKKYGRISMMTLTKTQADYLVSKHKLFQNKEYSDLKFESEDNNWFVYKNDNRRIYFKKDIGTVFMNKTEYLVDNKWLSKYEFKKL